MPKLQRTQIYLERAQMDALDARARASGVSRSDLIRAAIDQALAAAEPAGPEKPTIYDVLMSLPPLTGPMAEPGWLERQRAAVDRELSERAAAFAKHPVGQDE